MFNCSDIIVLLFMFVTSSSILVSAQYCIKEGSVPSYLHHKFQDITDDIFPNDIRISLSLSRVSGTLLYSIDNRMNQLIISLIDTLTLHIEFSQQQFYLSLTDLCGCQRCRYEEMDLRIQMRYFLYFQCNDRRAKKIKYDVTKQLNEYYPIPFKKNQNQSKTYDAHVWLVNTPQYEGLYPNNDQLSGCIFKVSYNANPIMFTDITDNIGRKCIKRCTRDICNGGQCYETYSDHPLCNCTTSFLNGPFCNDTLYQINKRLSSRHFMFDMFKLSWNSDAVTIMEINNTDIHLRLFRNGKGLICDYNYKKTTITSILSYLYIPNNDYILIGTFKDTIIDIQLIVNSSLEQTIIPTNRDLRKEIFHSMSLISGRGRMDFVYKTQTSHYQWRRSNFHDFEDIHYALSVIDVRNSTIIHPADDLPGEVTNGNCKQELCTNHLLITMCVVEPIVVGLIISVCIPCILTNIYGSDRVSIRLKYYTQSLDHTAGLRRLTNVKEEKEIDIVNASQSFIQDDLKHRDNDI